MKQSELAIFKSYGITEEDINSSIIDIKARVDDAYLNNAGEFYDINKSLEFDLEELYNMDKEELFFMMTEIFGDMELENKYKVLIGDKLGSDPYIKILCSYQYIEVDLNRLKIKNKIKGF